MPKKPMIKCDHPKDQVESWESGSMRLSGGNILDKVRVVYFCKSCRQVVDESDLPWLHETIQVEELEQIPF